MAIKRVFAVRDSKLGVFMVPFNQDHVGQALRAFEGIAQSTETLVGKYPADFALYELGTWDDITGAYSNHAHPAMLGTALEVLDSARKLNSPVSLASSS